MDRERGASTDIGRLLFQASYLYPGAAAMRIAFISYEYPPDTAIGGIGTYVYNAARMLRDRGHEVEVFTAGTASEGVSIVDDIRVHRSRVESRKAFPMAAAAAFAQRHRHRAFEVLEGPEFGAEAAVAVSEIPDIPLVVKLHTPSFLARQLNRSGHSPYARLRTLAANTWNICRRRGFFGGDDDCERHHARDADQIASPSLALAELVAREWRIPLERIHHLPNPFVPSPALLTIAPPSTDKVVTFIGRLETRKGVVEFAKAIPLVLERMADTRFRLIGNSSGASPEPVLDMHDYLLRMLGPWRTQVEFVEHVPQDAIPSFLAATTICVFPSLWENFPYVCLEAMAAGRAVIGSSAGGMAEMLDHGQAGQLLRPCAPTALADAIVRLLADVELIRDYGRRARARVLSEYSFARIGELQEGLYHRAIERRQMAAGR